MTASIEEAVELYVENRYHEAVGVLERLLHNGQDDGLIHHHLGKAYFALGDYLKAARALMQAVRINAADSESLFWLGRTYLANKKPTEAIKALNKCLELVPIHPGALYTLGMAYKAQG